MSYLNDDSSDPLIRTFKFRGDSSLTEAIRSWSYLTGKAKRDPLILNTDPILFNSVVHDE